MKQNSQITGLIILIMLTNSCVPSWATVPSTETRVVQPEDSTDTPPFMVSITPADQSVYIDSDGWFSVNIPANWKSQSTNFFSGEDGFFETGFLPDMMFMQHVLDVCQWVANIDSKSTHAISWFFMKDKSIGCTLYPVADSKITQSIIKNPGAELSKRFFFIKTDPEHHDEIIKSFVWLRPVDQDEEILSQQMPLRPEDISFWKHTSGIPSGFLLTQYALLEGAQNESPAEEVFLKFIPPNVPSKERKPGTVWFSDTLEEVNEKIKPFGYELKLSLPNHLQDLYKDGSIVIKNIYKRSEIYRFSGESRDGVAFIVYIVKDPSQSFLTPNNSESYLIHNGVILKRKNGLENPMSPQLPPILHNEELLWVQATENVHVEVQTSNQDTIFSFATYYGAQLPVNGFTGWNNHWVLEIGSFMIQDGEILNAKFGFEEVFDWGLLDNKPLYFFRKGARVGMSYDGEFLPFSYDYIVHGYCCGLALNNPAWDENDVRFFARKDGVWYYVIAETK